MRCIGKGLLILSIALVVLALVLAGAGVWFVRRPWPQVDGTIEVAGLSAPVEIVRDRWGVPHLYAQNEPDLFFAQGYVHAQDRLWQMEFNRRIGSGTLSAALGESTLDTDRFLRTLGLDRAAEKDRALLDDETRTILQAYAAGVNAYVETHSDRLPLEFTILGVDPEPWTALDSLAWGKVMSFDLGGNYEVELLRAGIIARLGPEAAEQLFPPYPDGAPVIIPPEARDYVWLNGAASDALDTASACPEGAGSWQAVPCGLEAVLGPRGPLWGSNNWVVHGSRTATGLPLLANDTHLGLNMPSIWYEIGLHGGRFDSVGFSFPGAPMVIIGHNARIAWGVTNLGPDVQDLYIEKLDNPQTPAKYEFQGQWHDLEVRHETIEVKGAEPVPLDVLVTRHGPILNGVLEYLEGAEPMALQWTALDATTLFTAVAHLNLAGNWDEFRQALQYWDTASQNFVYADVEGNIGYQSGAAKIPLRAAGHQGLVPVPGWTGEYEWQGFVPFEELPSILNPATGFVATANNKIVPDDYPYFISSDWAAPYRAQRITDLLAADDGITIEDMQAIHAQTYSLPAEALRPTLLAVQPEDDLQAQALVLVKAWDLQYETDRPGASVYQVWYWFLLQNTVGDELGEELAEGYLAYEDTHVPMMIDLVSQADSPWFDDVTTPQVETRDDIARRSLADAVAWLSEHYGDTPEEWQWGRVHTMTFVHQPLGLSGIGLLENLFNSDTIPARGDNFTVDAASYNYTEPFAMVHGVSERYIADLRDLGNSLTIHTTGQSGQLFHPHREDFISAWQNVAYHPMLFSREAVEANAEATLTLTPPD